MMYESLMGYAYGHGGTTPGANKSTMQNLIDAEAGSSHVAPCRRRLSNSIR